MNGFWQLFFLCLLVSKPQSQQSIIVFVCVSHGFRMWRSAKIPPSCVSHYDDVVPIVSSNWLNWCTTCTRYTYTAATACMFSLLEWCKTKSMMLGFTINTIEHEPANPWDCVCVSLIQPMVLPPIQMGATMCNPTSGVNTSLYKWRRNLDTAQRHAKKHSTPHLKKPQYKTIKHIIVRRRFRMATRPFSHRATKFWHVNAGFLAISIRHLPRKLVCALAGSRFGIARWSFGTLMGHFWHRETRFSDFTVLLCYYFTVSLFR